MTTYSTRLQLPMPDGGDYDTRANHNALVTAAEVTVADKPTVDGHVAAAAPHSGHETLAGAQARVDTHNADPNAHPSFARGTDLSTHKTANPIDHPNGSVIDAAIGNRTVDPSQAPASNGPAAITTLFSWLANRIKAILGTTNWWDAPATTLYTAGAHIGNTANPHSTNYAQVGAAPISHTSSGDHDSRYSLRTSANRPGPTKLYRVDDDSGYGIETYWDGSHWYVYGYDPSGAAHAGVRTTYADSAGSATSAGTATNQSGGTVNATSIYASGASNLAGLITGAGGFLLSGPTPAAAAGQLGIGGQQAANSGAYSGVQAQVHIPGDAGPNDPVHIVRFAQVQLDGEGIFWLPLVR